MESALRQKCSPYKRKMTKKLPFSLLLLCRYFGRVATLLPKGAFSDVKKVKTSGQTALVDNLFPLNFRVLLPNKAVPL